jgi:predicted transcriptional regulator
MRDAGVTTAAAIAERNDKKTNLEKNKGMLLQYIRDNVIGSSSDTLIQTVYGEKPLVYADYTASGRSLRFIETYI